MKPPHHPQQEGVGERRGMIWILISMSMVAFLLGLMLINACMARDLAETRLIVYKKILQSHGVKV